MGLFSNNKKLCPICGAPTPRLLATKVEDMPLCKDCAGKIDMQDGLDSSMTLDEAKQAFSALMPAHLEADFVTGGLNFEEFDALDRSFEQLDRLDKSWSELEMMGAEQWQEVQNV